MPLLRLTSIETETTGSETLYYGFGVAAFTHNPELTTARSWGLVLGIRCNPSPLSQPTPSLRNYSPPQLYTFIAPAHM